MGCQTCVSQSDTAVHQGLLGRDHFEATSPRLLLACYQFIQPVYHVSLASVSLIPVHTTCISRFSGALQVQPLDEREMPVTTGVYVRSGLLGFVGNVSLY